MRQLAVLALLLLASGCGGDGEDAARPTTAAVDAPGPVLKLPYDLAVDAEGQIYIADGLLHQVLRVDLETGESEVFAGTGEVGSDGDGGGGFQVMQGERRNHDVHALRPHGQVPGVRSQQRDLGVSAQRAPRHLQHALVAIHRDHAERTSGPARPAHERARRRRAPAT